MRHLCIAYGSIVFAISTPAFAQEADNFGSQGYFVLSAERLGGLAFTHDTSDDAVGGVAVDRTQKTTSFGFGTNLIIYSPYLAPRPAFDVFVTDGISVGAGISLWMLGGEIERDGGGVSTQSDLDDIVVFNFAPRVGYGTMFAEYVGIWARAGATYYSLATDDPDSGNESSETGFALTLEAYLAIVPLQHFAILIGPVGDIGLTGETESRPSSGPNTSSDLNRNHYGASLALAGWF